MSFATKVSLLLAAGEWVWELGEESVGSSEGFEMQRPIGIGIGICVSVFWLLWLRLF